jgi:hypothetical protein
VILLLLQACTPPAITQDAALFSSALQALESPQAMGLCEQIQDSVTRADCQTQVVLRRGDGSCDAVDPGTYRDECYFHSAEQANRAGKAKDAAEFCSKSGQFAKDCQQHLWQSPLRTVMQHQQSFTKRYELAHEVYCEWQPLLGEEEGFEDRFWDRGWNSAMAQDWRTDISACAALTTSQRERCEKGGAHLLAGKLDDQIQSDEARAALCESGSLGKVEFVSHPLLEQVVERHIEAVCEQGLDRPPSRDAPITVVDPDLVSPEVCP